MPVVENVEIDRTEIDFQLVEENLGQAEHPTDISNNTYTIGNDDEDELRQNLFVVYITKLCGAGKTAPNMQPPYQILASFVLAFIGIFLVSLTDFWYLTRTFYVKDEGVKMLTAAYGASAGNLVHEKSL